MDYYKFTFQVTPVESGREILLADLENYPFDSFEDTPTGLIAYIPASEGAQLEEIEYQFLDLDNYDVGYEKEFVKADNWNKEWESNFHPIVVEDKLFIRAPFHDPMPGIPLEIVIEPKMSFGTGHHQTTSLIASFMLQYPPKGKAVLDMGCGTGILAILAKKLGAADTVGIDIDEWAYENACENVKKNGYPDIEIMQGGVDRLGDRFYEVIFANINRNILLEDMKMYIDMLRENGELYMSGFYEEDIEIITKTAQQLGMKLVQAKLRDNWAAVRLIKEES